MTILDDAAAVMLLIKPLRAIGYIIPNVVIEEVTRDSLFVTQHPVERGASISDHAFAMPVELEMRCGWSDSTVGFVGYSAIVYQAMLGLQDSREPFTVFTPGRSYPNMLISALEKTTNEQMANSLMLRVGMRQVIIVDTEVTSTGNAQSRQAQPAKTSTQVNAGTKQLQSTGHGPH